MRGAKMLVGLCIVFLLVFAGVFSSALHLRPVSTGLLAVSLDKGIDLKKDGGDPVPLPRPSPSPSPSPSGRTAA
jgi:hypothetical protein